MKYSVLDAEGYVVRCGIADDLATCLIQAGPGEEVIVELDAEEGDRLLPNGQVMRKPVDLPVITIDMVKAEQGRRLAYTDWAVARAADPTSGHDTVPEAILAERSAIREAAARIEAMDPIPIDYQAGHYWQ